jgi:hypothetical protein
VLLAMSQDAQGAHLLKTLNLDGFVPGSDALYSGIETMARLVGKARK